MRCHRTLVARFGEKAVHRSRVGQSEAAEFCVSLWRDGSVWESCFRKSDITVFR